MKLAAALLLSCALTPVAAQPQAQLVMAGSEVSFTTRQMGVPVQGQFGSFSAQVRLDPKNPASGSVSVIIDTASARFGTAELDREIGQPGWLASSRFPQARFTSTAVRGLGGGRFEVLGQLELKGTRRELRVPVSLATAGAHSVASGAFVIDRLQFAIGENEWADTSLLAADVQVRFKLVLAGLPAP